MTLGTNTGEQFDSEFEYLAASYQPAGRSLGASGKPTGKSSEGGGYQGSPEPEIDRNHHVPLVASALTDDQGRMYGMAIDHRVPAKPEYEKHLWNHEAFENDYMNDLVKTGMSSQDAYHKAHDWSTARESAAVTAEFGEKGLEDYKQHWRDAASVASEPTNAQRHPDAHTTRHGLDEAETGQKFSEPFRIQLTEDASKLSDVSVNAFHQYLNEHLQQPSIQDFTRPLPGTQGNAAPAVSMPFPSRAGNIPPPGSSTVPARAIGTPVRGGRLEQQPWTAEDEAIPPSFRTPRSWLDDMSDRQGRPSEVQRALEQRSPFDSEFAQSLRQKYSGSGQNYPKPQSITLETQDKRHFDFKDEEGNLRGYVSASQRGETIHIGMIASDKGWYGKNDFGPTIARSILRQLREHFPDANRIDGFRVSGARRKAGAIGSKAKAEMDFPKD